LDLSNDDKEETDKKSTQEIAAELFDVQQMQVALLFISYSRFSIH
jgi:hypothetical protein